MPPVVGSAVKVDGKEKGAVEGTVIDVKGTRKADSKATDLKRSGTLDGQVVNVWGDKPQPQSQPKPKPKPQPQPETKAHQSDSEDVDRGMKGQKYSYNTWKAMREVGEWSSGIWQCEHAEIVAGSAICPCFLVWDILSKSGPVDWPMGRLDRCIYIACFFGAFVPFLIVELWSGMPPVWREPKDIPWAHTDGIILPFYYVQTVGSILLAITMWCLNFLVLRSVRDHYRVHEVESVTCLKTACWPDGMFCCQPFFLAQVARHVHLAQGFKEPSAYQRVVDKDGREQLVQPAQHGRR